MQKTQPGVDVDRLVVLAKGDCRPLRERARAESQANAAALQSNRDALSRLEEMIAARIGTPVRHVRSEQALTPQPGPRRAIVHRRGYTIHWFEPKGMMDARLRTRFGGDGQIAVFVKSSLVLRTRPQLEFILNEHAGQGFRAPYFFGQFSVSDMQVAAWEAIDIHQVAFPDLSFEDQERVVRAIASVNALTAAGAAPVLTRWIDRRSNWFEARLSELPSPASKRWQDLYARTLAVLEHQSRLAKRVRSAGESFVTHNDVTEDGSNILVPKDGDVIIFDWEGSTLSVPGADLGLLTQAASGERLMTVYVEEMADKGINLDPDRVRFTAEVVWGFRLLQGAWRRSMPHQAELALSMLARHTNGS